MRRSSVLALAALLYACTHEAPSQPLPPPQVQAHRHVDEAQSGSTVRLKVGQRVAIELTGLARAGYLWKAVEVPPFLVEEEPVLAPTDRRQAMPGFGGDHWDVHLFTAADAGDGRLTLHLVGPDETGAASRSFSIRVVAR